MPAPAVTILADCTLTCVLDHVWALCAAFYQATAVNETIIACPPGDICQPLNAYQLQAGYPPIPSCKESGR